MQQHIQQRCEGDAVIIINVITITFFFHDFCWDYSYSIMSVIPH